MTTSNRKTILGAALLALASLAAPAQAQEGFLGEIRMFGGNFAPRAWAFCNGQLLSIASNDALFSIIGCTYGGDCRTTFALPDLRGRVPIHEGNGPGLSNFRLGQKGGTETFTLTATNMPSHNHSMRGTSTTATSDNPADKLFGVGPGEAPTNVRYTSLANQGTPSLKSTSIANTGGGQSMNNMQPTLAVSYIIATQGLYPSRN